ncbi:MAG TPA: LytTR family DNA-binding domain-containing protein [Arachnia sp.]|nr:LytTR family DNA-binding domain-containing protein [Arachnia sp.]HMT86145.1 LytTR family DNA-binding domain-containing protein [Arachnia sp.]
MFRVAVVDDERESRELILNYLARYAREQGVQISTEEFADGSELVASYRPRFDILFLDVDMKNLDGLSSARIIREKDPAVVVIFITNMAQFAVKGYEVDALSYLVKPVFYFAFCQEVGRAIKRLERNLDEHVLLNIGGELIRVDLGEVTHIESVKHHLLIHTLSERIQITGTLKDMASRLENYGFVRTNSFLMVNLRHVVGFRNQVSTLTGGLELPVSRSRKKPFLEALTQYFGGQVR